VPGRQAKCSAPGFDASSDGLSGIGGLGDAVVLHDDQQRYLPYRSQVHALIKQALAQRAITNDHRHQRPTAFELARQREACSNTCHPSLDAIAVEMLPCQVLTAPASATHTALAPHNLGHQPDEIPGIGQEVTMVTMVGQDSILGVV